jgi:hypothetical protein
MARLAFFLMGWVLIALVCPNGASADGLRKVERTTSGSGHGSGGRSHSSSSGGGSSSSSRSWSNDGQGCGLFGQSSCQPEDSLTLWFFAYTIGAPWTVPARHFDDSSLVGYAAYPFADGPGLLRPPRADAAATARKVAIALDAESGYMLQGVVPSGLALRVLLPHRLELDGRLSGLSDVKERPVEVASAGTAHLTYRFAQGARYDFRTGIGLRMFQLDSLQLGFDLLYGLDTYLGPRVVWRVELHMGSAGQAFVGQVRSTLGAMIHRFEIYAGYDHTAYISGESKAALGGPIAGLRAWF